MKDELAGHETLEKGRGLLKLRLPAEMQHGHRAKAARGDPTAAGGSRDFLTAWASGVPTCKDIEDGARATEAQGNPSRVGKNMIEFDPT